MNLQQLRNVNFTYTVAQGTVIANYVDEQGNTIAQQETTSGDIDTPYVTCLLYTSDAADEEDSVDLGGRRIIQKKRKIKKKKKKA